MEGKRAQVLDVRLGRGESESVHESCEAALDGLAQPEGELEDETLSPTQNETDASGSGILTDGLRASLAQQASEVGVMQAAPGTEQGSSGWYVDVSSEVQYWNVGADGSWTRGE